MPEAILLADVDGVGVKGTVVDVSKGYLRNFLIPRRLAAPATKGLLAQAQVKIESEDRAKRAAFQRAGEFAEQLNKTVLTLSEKAGEDGRLFGSITNQDIADAIMQARGIEVDKRKVHLEEPIKNVGTYAVIVELGDGITASVKTMVTEA